MNNKIYKLLSTFFGLGYSPFAPGTVGTLGAVVFYLLLVSFLDTTAYLAITFIVIAVAVAVSSEAVKIFEKHDPQEVVIDEVAGFLVTMLFLEPTFINIVLGFILFRAFDILKPFPCRKLESLRGGYGIVMDDVAAGVWANIIIHFVNYLLIN